MAPLPAMAPRMDPARTLAEELFVLWVMDDDKAILGTCVAGIARKTRSLSGRLWAGA